MADTTTYQCPNCSGKLSFDSSIGKLRCEFCDSSFTVEEVERIFAAKQEKADAKAASDRRAQIASEFAASGTAATSKDFEAAALAAYDRALREGKSVEEATAAAYAAFDAASKAGAAGAHAASVSAAAASTSSAAQAKPHVQSTGDPIKDYIANSHWDSTETDDLRAYNCPACGAQLMVDQVTAVTNCPYCGNNAVVPGQLSDILKPDYVIPFKLDKDAAVQALKNYYQGKKLLPDAFSDQNHIEEIQGVYVPFWLYSGTGSADATFNGRNIRTWTDSKNLYTETDHYILHREGTMDFVNIPVDGSTKMPDAHMDAIEPFDYSEMVPFSMAYLPGYITDRYDQDVEQCGKRAGKRAENTCDDVIQETAGGFMEIDLANSDSHVHWTNVAYALLPVWMLHTKWNGEDYLFAMNGQTGKLIGDLPIDNGKVIKQFLKVFIPVALVVLVIVIFLLWL